MLQLNEDAYRVFCELNNSASLAKIQAAVKLIDTARKRGEKRAAVATTMTVAMEGQESQTI